MLLERLCLCFLCQQTCVAISTIQLDMNNINLPTCNHFVGIDVLLLMCCDEFCREQRKQGNLWVSIFTVDNINPNIYVRRYMYIHDV